MGYQAMYKIYDTCGNLIGYNSNEINTSNRQKLFEIECVTVETKLNALDIPESDRCKYYWNIMKNIYYTD